MSTRQVQVSRREGETSCPLCREPVRTDELTCPGCDTRYHRACAREMGGCATLGCPRVEEKPAARRDRQRRRGERQRADFLSRWEQETGANDFVRRWDHTQEPPPRPRPGLLRELWDRFDGVQFSCGLLASLVMVPVALSSLFRFSSDWSPLSLVLVGLFVFLVFTLGPAYLGDRFWLLNHPNPWSADHGRDEWWR